MTFAPRNKRLANVNMTSQQYTCIFGLRDVGGASSQPFFYAGAMASLGAFSSLAY